MRFGRSGLSSDVIALFTLQQHGERRQPLQGPPVNASMAGLPRFTLLTNNPPGGYM
jgi:hypothetical protein